MKELSLPLNCLHKHGGIAIGMKVKTAEGDGSEFIIQLPNVTTKNSETDEKD